MLYFLQVFHFLDNVSIAIIIKSIQFPIELWMLSFDKFVINMCTKLMGDKNNNKKIHIGNCLLESTFCFYRSFTHFTFYTTQNRFICGERLTLNSLYFMVNCGIRVYLSHCYLIWIHQDGCRWGSVFLSYQLREFGIKLNCSTGISISIVESVTQLHFWHCTVHHDHKQHLSSNQNSWQQRKKFNKTTKMNYTLSRVLGEIFFF